MRRDEIIKNILPETVMITPQGVIAEELGDDKLNDMLELFFEKILEIHKANIDGIEGYGEFNELGETGYETCREFLIGTFDEFNEGYWYNWKEMFETTVLNKDFFYEYYRKMEELIDYCEGKRYLVNNNTFFVFMITDGENKVGFPDWTRSGITDYILDIVLMDLNKPNLMIPERFYEYCQKKGIEIEHFKERFLCMAYYKGIDTLRWHASIDDYLSCQGIMNSVSALEERINKLY